VGDRGDALRARIDLPEDGPVDATGTVVRVAGGVTALDLRDFAGDGRERLAAFVLARQRAAAAAAEPAAAAA
jgi:hypothetical protein